MIALVKTIFSCLDNFQDNGFWSTKRYKPITHLLLWIKKCSITTMSTVN